ncbi:VWA domain-containing protein [Acidianus brierleyi]|uniref:CoxE n=1 Tax=Acidianus brierleyi TaxID=41673 RepID=A0A2U9II98_9CREN|nr:VWA domain-containing protein [Acidianus brierleyi]AWR95731.1 VWA domain-containing protein [Acidianus brierleyi]
MEEEIIIKFVNILRRLGKNVGINETIDAINSIKIIKERDFNTIKAILETTLIKDFSYDNSLHRTISKNENKYSVTGKITQNQYISSNLLIYSPEESRIKMDNLKISMRDQIRWKKIANRIKLIALSAAGHRSKPKNNGNLDIKRIIKNEPRYACESPYLIKSIKKINKSNIVLLCDVSGSMKDFFKDSLLLSFFTKRIIPKTEIFYFSTDLRRVTNLFQVTSINSINLRKLVSITSYGSGTKIGETLYTFRRKHGDFINRKVNLIVFSDGWDLGDLRLLEREMKIIRRKSNLLIWIDPLLDNLLYSPLQSSIKIIQNNADLLISPSLLYKTKIDF